MPSKVEETIVEQTGIISKITSFISTKKGLYLVGAILLVGAIYYYTSFSKESKNTDTQNVEEEIPQPPPGYVTIPVEMLEGLQRGNNYQELPQNYNQQMDLQTQQQIEMQQQQIGMQQQQMEMQQQQEQIELQNQKKVPKLKHNKQLQDDDEEDEIAEQNLSKDEMESIQAQLNAMQQQRGNTNNA